MSLTQQPSLKNETHIMKMMISTVLALLISLPSFGQETALTNEPGFVDFGNLEQVYGEPNVMINVSPTFLSLLANASKDDPEASELLKDLKGVRISVYETAGKTGPAIERVAKVRRMLSAAQWQPIVQTKEHNRAVQIYTKLKNEKMQGLAVMAVDNEEAVFINIVGAIDPAQLGNIMEQFDVDLDLLANINPSQLKPTIRRNQQ